MRRNHLQILVVITLLLSITACSVASPSNNEEVIIEVEPADTDEIETESAEIQTTVADIIFWNASVITMDNENPLSEGLAIKGNKIIAVGTNDNVLNHKGPMTTTVNLDGLTVLPGIIDTHNHFYEHIVNDYEPKQNEQSAIAYGITAMADMFGSEEFLEKTKSLSDSDKIHVRLNLYLLFNTNCGEKLSEWWKSYQPNEKIGPNLHVRGIKIFTDGGSCNIPAMSVEYPGGGFGDLYFSQDELNQAVVDVQSQGFQIAIHALGDRAVEQAQNAIEFTLDGKPNALRHRIDHNATIRPELLSRYSEIGIMPVIFGAYPTCIRTAGTGSFKYVLSPQYGEWDWPWRKLMDENPNLKIAWHSDFPGPISMNPFYHMWGMVTRNQINDDGSVCVAPDWLKQGALEIDEVLPMMTINAAYALNMEKEIGSIEAGKLADILILSENPLKVETEGLKDIKNLMTMIDGEMLYCAPGFEEYCPIDSQQNQALVNEDLGKTSRVTASKSQSNESPNQAVDGLQETIWNSGDYPDQWLQLDFGGPKSISYIKLYVSQYPTGDTVHQIWGGDAEEDLRLIFEFTGRTSDKQELEFIPQEAIVGIRLLRIITTKSPSWVAWREIRVFGN